MTRHSIERVRTGDRRSSARFGKLPWVKTAIEMPLGDLAGQ
jgi:hypothetical protein